MQKKLASLIFIFLMSSSFAHKLKDGDLILRRSPGFISQQYSKLSEIKEGYSHIGIFRQGKVHHIEAKTLFSDNDYHRDSIEDFLKDSDKWTVYRSEYGDLLSTALNEYHNLRTTFDFLLRLDNEDLYCTEFIYLILEDVISNSVQTKVSFSDRAGVSIGNILKAREFNFREVVQQ